MGVIFFEFLVFVINIVLLFAYIKISHHYHWFDQPDESRKLHSVAKPTSAGLIFMFPVMLAFLTVPNLFSGHSISIAVGVFVLMVLGGIDDFKPISVKFRLLVISVVSAYLLFTLFSQSTVSYLVLGVYLLGLIWWLNLFNFMDGIDGMVTLHALIAAVGYMAAFMFLENGEWLVLIYMLVFVFCLLSFLLFNFPVSKLFMGDSGSLSVAFVLASFGLYGLSVNIFDEVLIISFHLVFIMDATLTLFARIKFKHKISQAHSLHCFQEMVREGRSHGRVSTYYALVTTVNVSIAFYMEYSHYSFSLKLMVLLIEILVLSLFWFNFHNKTKFERFVKP